MNSTVPAIQNLRLAADAIENQTIPFRWGTAPRCTCGILAQVTMYMDADALRIALSRSHAEIRSLFEEHSNGTAVFNYYAHKICDVTKLSMDNVYRVLYDSGLSLQAIGDLEILSDPEIRKRAGLPLDQNDYSNPKAIVPYMRALADSLEAK